MRITILGTGYVGLVTGASLAEVGHDVTCADIDVGKVSRLQEGIMPFFEGGLEELVRAGVDAGRLAFSSQIPEALAQADIVMCAVGTPPRDDGSADLSFVDATAEAFRAHAALGAIFVVKSTVPPGTCNHLGIEYIAHNPEFLKQGSAVADARRPDRIVLGCANDHVRSSLIALYQPFAEAGVPVVMTDVRTAEMIKYAANAFLATKISFINEIANFCEQIGANVSDVVTAVGLDPRIGPAFLRPGVGYGGSCFPKDVQALVAAGETNGYRFRILPEVHAVNRGQRERYYAKMLAHLGGSAKGRRVAIWGLSFKPGTDDIREAPSVYFIERLLAEGAEVLAHDPVAMPRIAAQFPAVQLVDSPLDAVVSADILVRLTDDPSFPPVPPNILVVDGRL